MLKAALALFMSLFLVTSAAAEDLAYEEAKAQLPSVAPGKARVIFMRGKFLGAIFSPDVVMNGKVITSASAGDFFLVDRVPGEYEIAVTTEVTRTLKLSLAAGETKYVIFDVAMGFFAARISPRLIDEATGLRELGFGLTWKRDVPVSDPTEAATAARAPTAKDAAGTTDSAVPRQPPAVSAPPTPTEAVLSPAASSVASAQGKVASEPGNPDAWTELGTAYKNEGKYESAVKAFSEALRLKPDSASALYGLGEAYHFLHDRGNVGSVYQRLSAIDKAMGEKFFNAFILP